MKKQQVIEKIGELVAAGKTAELARVARDAYLAGTISLDEIEGAVLKAKAGLPAPLLPKREAKKRKKLTEPQKEWLAEFQKWNPGVGRKEAMRVLMANPGIAFKPAFKSRRKK